jgi:uncharacterized protein YjiK
LIGGGNFISALLSKDGQNLYLLDKDGEQVYIVDTQGKVVRIIPFKGAEAREMILRPDGNQLIILGPQDNSLEMIDLKQTAPTLKNIEFQDFGILIKGVFTKDSRHLFILTSSPEHTVVILDAKTFQVVKTIPWDRLEESAEGALIADEHCFAFITGNSEELELVDPISGRVLHLPFSKFTPTRIVYEKGAPVCLLGDDRVVYVHDGDKYL